MPGRSRISSAASRRPSASASSSSAAGWCSSSPSANFGGWSGLVMEADGKSLLAISDVGSWMTADVAYEGSRPTGLKSARLGPLLGSRGQPLKNKREQDAEGVTLLDGTLAERHAAHQLRAPASHRPLPRPQRRGAAPTGYLKLPADAKGMRENQGIEALAVLQGGPRKGSIVAFAERLTRGSGYHTGWIWGAAAAARRRNSSCRTSTASTSPTRRAWPTAACSCSSATSAGREGVKMRLRHIAGKRDRAGRAHCRPHAVSRATPASRSTTWRGWPCIAAPAARPCCR